MVRRISIQRRTPAKTGLDKQPTILSLNTPNRRNVFPPQTPRLLSGNVASGSAQQPSSRQTQHTVGISQRSATKSTAFAVRGPLEPTKTANATRAASHKLPAVPVPLSAVDRMPAPAFIPNRGQDPIVRLLYGMRCISYSPHRYTA